MYKLILILLLALVSNSVSAAWVQVVKTDEGNMTTYANLANKERVGNKVKMWFLLDFKQPQTSAGNTYLSTKGQFEYDCKLSNYRMQYVSIYSGNMGGGELISDYSVPKNWRPVVPNPAVPDIVTEALLKAACHSTFATLEKLR